MCHSTGLSSGPNNTLREFEMKYEAFDYLDNSKEAEAAYERRKLAKRR
jgi:hypothetical protein